MNFFNGTVPPGRTVSFSLSRWGISRDAHFYDEHQDEVKNAVDLIARGLLDPECGHVMVIGFQGVGKSFLIEQFATNVDHYLPKTRLDSLVLVAVSQADANVVSTIPNGVNAYVEACCQTFDCAAENIVLVTESPDFAASVYASNSSLKIVLELNVSTFVQLNQREAQGASKIWSSWAIVDANEVLMTFEGLVRSLETVMVPKLQAANLSDLSEGEVPELVDYFLEKMPEAIRYENEDDERESGFIVVPPGAWGAAIRKLATILAFSSRSDLKNEYGSVDLAKAIEETFAELEGEFIQYIEAYDDSTSDDGSFSIPPGLLPPELQGSVVRVFQMGGHDEDEEDEEEDNSPVVFSNMKTLHSRLESTVMGQTEAVEAVVSAMTVPAAGLNDANKPIRSFLFLGPTGVGKTQLALSIAAQVAEEPMNVIRLDMSEYAQAHEASKLLGAPSGYVGYEEGGVLTNAVKQNPRSLIILDEVEKAHYKIWDSFLQILDAGRMTDNKGQIIDFSRTIIVMTSNLGAKNNNGAGSAAFFNNAQDSTRAREQVISEVEKFFRPEFVNRIDELVFFSPLSIETARQIVRREVTIVSDRMQPRGYKLSAVEDNVVDEIIKLSSFSKYGARDIQRAVFKNVSQPLAERILTPKTRRKTITLFMGQDNKIQVK